MWSTWAGVITKARSLAANVGGQPGDVPRDESARTNSWKHAARKVAGMFVSAAMAAYLPPLAWVPHMAMTAKRVPRSRAVLVDTAGKQF